MKRILIILLLSLGLISCAAPNVTQVPPKVSPTSSAQKEVPASVPNGAISLDKNFYIVVDGSGSMESSDNAGTFENKLTAAKWAITKFVTDVVPNDVNLGLYIFDASNNKEKVPLGKNNRQAILTAIANMRSGGNTPLNSAITTASKSLALQKQKQLGYGEYYIIVVTDGEANDGAPDASAGVSYAQKEGIGILTIGFGIQGTHALSKYSLSYRAANNPDTLFQALQETQGEADNFGK